MRKYCYILAAALIVTGSLSAATLHVPTDVGTIQEAIDAALNGDTVMVQAGTYSGPGNRDVDFRGKAIVVRSSDGPLSTIIDCQGSSSENHRGFNFQSSEGAASKLDGFDITGGYADEGAGIRCSQSSPTIANCRIHDNTGSGVYSFWNSPVLSGCRFERNSYHGIFGDLSSPTIQNCEFFSNSASGYGYLDGGAIFLRSPENMQIQNCVFGHNAGGAAGGIALLGSDYNPAYVEITSCTFADNSGAALLNDGCRTWVYRSIIAFNSAQPVLCGGGSFDISASDVFGNSGGDWVGCISGQEYQGNVSVDPFFCNRAANDYHLTDQSTVSEMGAMGVGCAAGRSWHVYADHSGDVGTIQEAVNSAAPGDTILLYPGVYTGAGNRDIEIGSKNVVLRGINGSVGTVIDCQGSQTDNHRALNIHDILSEGCVISGVTFNGGYMKSGVSWEGGAAITCRNVTAVITECRFKNNIVEGAIEEGGGAIVLANSAVTISHCIFSGNKAPHSIGGALTAHNSSATVENCTFAKNMARYGDAIAGWGDAANITIDKTIIAFNGQQGWSQQGSLVCMSSPTPAISCTDIHGNANGDWIGCAAGQSTLAGNFSSDPVFCDLANNDLRVSYLSDCAPEYNACHALTGAESVCGEPPQAGLVALWRLNEASGDAVADESGHSLGGTASGASVGAGVVGNARSFDGVDDYIEVPDNSLLDIRGGITIMLWAKIDQSVTEGILISKRLQDDVNCQINYDIKYGVMSGDPYLAFQFGSGCATGNNYIVSSGLTGLNDNKWHHLAVALQFGDHSTAKWIVDGVQKQGQWTHWDGSAGTGDDIPPVNSSGLQIGRQLSSSPAYFKGSLDQIRLYNEALDLADIQALYDEEMPKPYQETCDEFDGATINPSLWSAVSGSWSQSGGRVTGYWTVSDAYGDQANLLLASGVQPSGDYTFEADMVNAAGQNGHKVVLYHSSGSKYNINFLVQQQIAGVEVKVGGGIYHDVGIPSTPMTSFDGTAGAVNNIKVQRTGNQFLVYMNDSYLFTLTDAYWNGDVRIGLGAYGYATYERACLSTGGGTPGVEVPILATPNNGSSFLTTDAINFSWSQVDWATNYTIEFSTSSQTSSTPIGSRPAGTFATVVAYAALGDADSWLSVPRLFDEGSYYWHVMAVDEMGTTAFSAARSFSISVPSAETDWPMFCRDEGRTARTGVQVLPPYRQSWGESPFKASGPVRAPVVVVGDTVFLADCGGTVYALNVNTKAQYWSHPMGISGLQFWASPVYSNGRLFVTGTMYSQATGKVFCLNTSNGSTIWGPVNFGTSLMTAPTLVGDRLLVYDGLSTQVLNASNGTGVTGFPGGMDCPAAVWNGKAYFNTNSSFSCYDPVTNNVTTVAAGGRSPVAVSKDGHAYFKISSLASYDLNTNQFDWTQSSGYDWNYWPRQLAISEDYVIVPYGNSVNAVSRATGQVVWSASGSQGGQMQFNSPIVAGNTVLFAKYYGELYCVDITTGSELGYFQPTVNYCYSSPVAAKGKLFYGLDDGNLYALESGVATKAQLTVICFNDANGDGIKGGYENGIPGLNVSISGGMSGSTDAAGTCTFTVDAPADYTVTVATPGGYSCTGANPRAVRAYIGSNNNVFMGFQKSPVLTLNPSSFGPLSPNQMIQFTMHLTGSGAPLSGKTIYFEDHSLVPIMPPGQLAALTTDASGNATYTYQVASYVENPMIQLKFVARFPGDSEWGPASDTATGSIAETVFTVTLDDPAEGAAITLPYTFRWHGSHETGQVNYTIQFAQSSNWDSPVYAGQISTDNVNVSLQVGEPSLSPGQSYQWRVVAARADRPTVTTMARTVRIGGAPQAGTALSLTSSIAQCQAGGYVDFKAKLTDANGNPLSGKTVSFSWTYEGLEPAANFEGSFDLTTDLLGECTLHWFSKWAAFTGNVTATMVAQFSGDADYEFSTASKDLPILFVEARLNAIVFRDIDGNGSYLEGFDPLIPNVELTIASDYNDYSFAAVSTTGSYSIFLPMCSYTVNAVVESQALSASVSLDDFVGDEHVAGVVLRYVPGRTTTVDGKVIRNSNPSDPISGASVELYYSGMGGLAASTTTDNDGNFGLLNVYSEQVYALRVTALAPVLTYPWQPDAYYPVSTTQLVNIGHEVEVSMLIDIPMDSWLTQYLEAAHCLDGVAVDDIYRCMNSTTLTLISELPGACVAGCAEDLCNAIDAIVKASIGAASWSDAAEAADWAIVNTANCVTETACDAAVAAGVPCPAAVTLVGHVSGVAGSLKTVIDCLNTLLAQGGSSLASSEHSMAKAMQAVATPVGFGLRTFSPVWIDISDSAQGHLTLGQDGTMVNNILGFGAIGRDEWSHEFAYVLGPVGEYKITLRPFGSVAADTSFGLALIIPDGQGHFKSYDYSDVPIGHDGVAWITVPFADGPGCLQVDREGDGLVDLQAPPTRIWVEPPSVCSVLPSTWNRLWSSDPRGTIRSYIGNMPSAYTASNIVPSSIRLNGQVPIYNGVSRIRTSMAGFTGAVMEVSFGRQLAVRSLGSPIHDSAYQVIISGDFTDGNKFVAAVEVTLSGMVAKIDAEDEPIVEETAPLPKVYRLGDSYPNPFNPTASIEFDVAKDGPVQLEVFNIMGQRVRTLVDGAMSAGAHIIEWNSTDDNGNQVASGVYLYRLRAGDFVDTKKMVLMK